jgi:hypothetical protein
LNDFGVVAMNNICIDPEGEEQCCGDCESESYADSDFTGACEHEREKSEKEEVIAKNETKTVLRLKLVVLLVLVFSAVAVGTAVYIYTSGSEKSQFEQQFNDDSNKVLEAISSTIDKTLDSYDSLSVTLVSYARATNQTWPFVTLPDFAVRMSKLLPLSDAVAISVAPIVTPDKRLEWEAYALEHDSWVNESMAIQETWKNYYGPVIYDWEPTRVIHGDLGAVPYNET